MPIIDLPVCVSQDHTDPEYDRLAFLVQRATKMPSAFVNLVDQKQQVAIGAAGLPEGASPSGGLGVSFCQYVVMSEQPLIIPDAANEPLVAGPFAETGLDIGAYAGYPIRDTQEHVVGSMCVIDNEPHDWTDEELNVLEGAAELCSVLLRQRHMLDLVAEAIDE